MGVPSSDSPSISEALLRAARLQIEAQGPQANSVFPVTYFRNVIKIDCGQI